MLRIRPLGVVLLALVAIGTACSSSAGTTTSAGAAPAVVAGPSAAELASIARGDSLFNTGGCQRCHGQKGIGAQNGPSLVEGQWLHADGTVAGITAVITNGVAQAQIKDATRRFAMRPRGGPMSLTDEQVADVAAYVVSISRAKTPK